MCLCIRHEGVCDSAGVAPLILNLSCGCIGHLCVGFALLQEKRRFVTVKWEACVGVLPRLKIYYLCLESNHGSSDVKTVALSLGCLPAAILL
jgi:hypothetical protein